MLDSITVLGSSSGQNAGDAALIAGLMDWIDRTTRRQILYEIPSLRPGFIRRSYAHRVRPIGMLPWNGALGMFGLPTLRSVPRTDMTLVYDNMLFDKKLHNPLWNYMPATRALLPHAKRANKILGCYNIGAGPVTTQKGRQMLQQIADMMDFVTVRDEESLELLREIGVTNPNILVTADAAISVAPAPAERVNQIITDLGLNDEREILAVNVNNYVNSWTGIEAEAGRETLSPHRFAQIYAAGLSRAAAEIGAPVLFVVTQPRDIPVTRLVMSHLKPGIRCALFTNEHYGHHDIKGVLSRVSLLFAMRLHSLILATSACTPGVPLVFQKKVVGYYRRLGLEQYLLHFSEFSADSVYQAIVRGWSDREIIRRTLEMRIPELAREADKAAELVLACSRGEDPTAAIRRLSLAPTHQL